VRLSSHTKLSVPKENLKERGEDSRLKKFRQLKNAVRGSTEHLIIPSADLRESRSLLSLKRRLKTLAQTYFL
jgi:hypothetical protein